jgi:hypothetical protein
MINDWKFMKRLLISGITLSALALVVVGATGAFFNDTETSSGNVFIAGSVDLKVDHYFQTYNGNDCEEFCEPTGPNLVENGDFSSPDIPSGEWDIVASDDVPGWTVEWESTEDSFGGEDRPEPALAEYQDGVNGWNAYDGQWVELDSDWDGPSGSLSGEPASTRILQDIDTTPGTKYRIEFAFSPRPGSNNTQNQLEVVWNGVVVDTLSESGGGNTNWQEYSYDVMASGEDTTLEFADVGIPDSEGTFIDAIAVYELDCDYTLPGATQCQLWEETDINDERFFDFTDIKPGDNGRNGISLHVYDNPAYACLIAHDGDDDENTVFEAEGDDDDTAGELQDYITVFTWVDEDEDGLYDPNNEEALDTKTLGELGSIASLDSNNGEFLSATTTEYIGLAWCAGTIEVDDTTGEISCDGSTMLDDAQSDIFTASLTAFAEQTRHNDDFSCADVVLDEDDGGDSNVTTVDSNNSDWGFLDETTGSFPTGTANGSFVAGPASAPLGTGSAELAVTNGGGLVLGALLLTGQRLDEIDTLTYSTYRQSGDAPLAVSLQFNFTDDVTVPYPGWQGRLVYEPYHTDTVMTGSWQTWDTLNDAPTGNWWFTGAPGSGACPQSDPCTWSEVLAAFPNGGVNSSFGGVLLKAGGGWSSDFVGNVDDLTIGINGSTETFDFED